MAIASQAPPSRGWHVASCRPAPLRLAPTPCSGHPATSALTGSISGIGRASVPSLGQKGETTNTQTNVGKQNGLVLFTEIFLNHRPSGIEGSYVDSPPLKPLTIHAGTCFPGRSPLPTGDRPRWDLFSRKVNVWSGAGWCKATCHPRLGGACEGAAMCRKGRRGSPVPHRPATRGACEANGKKETPGGGRE